MRKRIILFWGVCLVMCLTACQPHIQPSETETEEPLKKGYSCYEDGVFGFSVDFPVVWSCESSAYWYPTETENGSPDSEVYIYINGEKENFIRVYGQHGQINPLDTEQFTKIDFTNEIGKNGTLYIKETDAQTEGKLFFKDNKHISAFFRTDSSIYVENKQAIMNVLKSIVY